MTKSKPKAKPKTPKHEMTLFPQGPVPLGRVAMLDLVSVTTSPYDGGKVARYRLRPTDALAFAATFSGAGPVMRQKYEPARGALWGMLDVPEDLDQVHLLVGVPKRYGQALVRARHELHPWASCVIPESGVKALARGILHREGQDV